MWERVLLRLGLVTPFEWCWDFELAYETEMERKKDKPAMSGAELLNHLYVCIVRPVVKFGPDDLHMKLGLLNSPHHLFQSR